MTWNADPLMLSMPLSSCGCEECVRLMTEDSLRHSLSRVNIYRALCSPSLICLTSSDPILTAFQLSWDLRNLALTEQECKSEYVELRRQCQQFACSLLDQTRTSNELAIILNYDPTTSSYEPGDRMILTRLVQAISYKQKQVGKQSCQVFPVPRRFFSVSFSRLSVKHDYLLRFALLQKPKK